jgi:hypothetical protein
MFQFDALVQAFHEEQRALAIRVNYEDEPALNEEQKVARAAQSHPIPNAQVLGRVVQEAFYASLLTEEGRRCHPRLVFLPDRESWPVHRLASPVELTRETLRKLGPAQGPRGYMTWSCDSTNGKPIVTGILMRQGGDPSGLIISAPTAGALDLNWMAMRLITLRAGRLDRISRYALPDVQGVLDTIRRLLGVFEPILLGRAIRAIRDDAHGGSLWLVREGASLDGVAVGHRVIPDARDLLARKDQVDWIASIGHLAAVDGAVLLDARLRVLGFGVFIKLGDGDVPVSELLRDGNRRPISRNRTGGGRHRSAIEFCHTLAPAAATSSPRTVARLS